MPISLVLADDHPLVLDGLEGLFGHEPDFEVLARCRDGEEALRAVRELKPDVLILDIRMPKMDGLELVRAMRGEGLMTRVVLLTAALDDDALLDAVRLGVKGIVLKEMAPQLLVQCARTVHAGEQWLEKRSVSQALERFLAREAEERRIAELLTPREIEIVRQVAQGQRNKEIARELSISEGTVKVHVHHIYQKLCVNSRVELATYARDRGIV
jgi:DNA-binding NarL/FixJ family response regulator